MGEKRSDIVTRLQMCLPSSGFQPTLGRVKSCFLGINPENGPLLSVLTISSPSEHILVFLGIQEAYAFQLSD